VRQGLRKISCPYSLEKGSTEVKPFSPASDIPARGIAQHIKLKFFVKKKNRSSPFPPFIHFLFSSSFLAPELKLVGTKKGRKTNGGGRNEARNALKPVFRTQKTAHRGLIPVSGFLSS